MNNQSKSNWKIIAVNAIATSIFMFAVHLLVFGQTNYTVGEKIEALKGGKWYKAQIIDVKDGKFKIHYEGYDSVMDVWTAPDHIRRIGGDNQAKDENNVTKQTQTPTSATKKAAKYHPGDRVECDKAQIGIWEKGTVMAFSPDDTNKNSGRFYRVRLDSFTKGGLYLAGHECAVDSIRPLAEAPLKASGKYKVGDIVEVQNSYLTWLPAKIIEVEGAFYKVRFESRDERYDETIDDLRIRKIGSGNAKTTEKPKNKTPKPTGVVTSLPGSAWSLRLYSRKKGYSADGTVQTMLFCPNGTWDTVRSGLTPGNAGAVGQRGTYKVAGKTLTLKNGQGGQSESYTITWLDANTVELSDETDIIWRLFNAVKSDCK